MRKIMLLVILSLFVAAGCFAGELRTLPQSIVLTNPTTNKVELLDLTFHFGANPYASIRYHILDDLGNVRGNHTVYIRNEVDDPNTPENEATTDFTTFIATIGTTIYSRMEAKVWADIQENYELQ